jgi:Winged helix DNA-binding domain
VWVTDRFDHDALAAVVYSDDPVLLLFGDDEGGLTRARAAAARAGCHIAGAVPLADAVQRLDDQAAVDAVLICAEQPSADLDRLLIRVQDEARRGRLSAVVVAPTEMMDAVVWTDFHPRVEHLFDPDALQLQAMLAVATAPAAPHFQDVTRGNGIGLLQQLSEEAARIAATLASLSETEAKPARAPADNGAAEPAEIDPAYVRAIIRARRLRDQFFRGELFADPAFDMLLDLFAARLAGNRVAVSSLCIAAAVPATTALRWIKALTDRGLFIRSADPQDGRRVYIELSDKAAQAMGSYLAAVQRTGITAI